MIENINWYPGHMKKTRELIKDNLKLVDVVIEVVDARIPSASRNPIIAELTERKPRVVCLNKSDLSDPAANKLWIDALTAEETHPQAVLTDCRAGSGIKDLLKALAVEEKKKYPEDGPHKPLRMMIVGVPNVGKSSLINRLTGKRTAKVGDRPGVTRGKQWLTLTNGMQLMDTPGILWPKFEDPNVGLVLAFCGSIRDEILDREGLALELIGVLARDYPEELAARYKIEELAETPLEVMEQIAKKRGFLLGGGRFDYERTANTVLDEFRSATIGRITLERP